MKKFNYEEKGSVPFLVYTLDYNEEIDDIALNMIRNSEINNILPVSYHQIDNQKKLEYNISSLVSMNRYLEGIVQKKRVLTVLKSVCDAFILSEDYLLDTKMFILDPEYIFVNTETGTVKMIYLAVEPEIEQMSFSAFFKQVITSIRMDLNGDCDYVPAMLNALNASDTISITAIRQLIISLEGDVTKKQQGFESGSGNSYNEPISKTPIRKNNQSDERAVSGEIESIINQALQKKDELINNLSNFDGNNSSIEKKSDQSHKRKEKSKGKSKKTDMAFEVPDFDVPGENDSEKQDNSKKKSKKKEKKTEKKDKDMTLLWLLRNFSSDNLKAYKAQKNNIEDEDVSDIDNGFESTFGLEELNNNSSEFEETMDLDSCNGMNKKACLVFIRKQEKILIDKDIFVIGRDSSKTNYSIVDNPAIGRRHAVIYRRGNSYFILDMNSKNSTFLYGEKIPANEEIELKDRAEIKLGNEDFVFCYL